MTDWTDEQAVALLHRMLAIPSPSGAEHDLAGFLAQALADAGFASRIDEVGNVIGHIGLGTGPTLMLLSHLDTVDRPLPVRRTGTALHGRGAVDAKGPLATMISAAARRPRFPGRIVVIGAVEEERLSRGGHHIVRTLPRPAWLIIGEPSGWSSVVLGYKGKIDIEFRARCRPTHSTNPVPKATELAVGFWLALREALGPDLDHGRFHLPAATLRRLDGDVLNAYLDVDCRVPPGFDLASFTAALRQAAGESKLNIARHIPAVVASRRNAVARCLSAGIRARGGQPRHVLKTGTSDMNTVGEHWPVPMAAYGPGDSSLDHGDDEHLPIDDYLTAVAALTACIDELEKDESMHPASDPSRPTWRGGGDGAEETSDALPAGRSRADGANRRRGTHPDGRRGPAGPGRRGAIAGLPADHVPARADAPPVHGPRPAQSRGSAGPALVCARVARRRSATSARPARSGLCVHA
jgi:LysW-gamma-L-lysine carboxypeptidase